MKRCIFHYPGPIQENPSSGSAVRPNRMLNAFKMSGYEVEEVTGFSKERAEKIKAVRKNIKNGVKYDEDTKTYTLTVTNNAGVALPNTGGPGTRLFTIIGSILALGAGLLLWRRQLLI